MRKARLRRLPRRRARACRSTRRTKAISNRRRWSRRSTANGFATVWASTQGQFTAELMIAAMLGLPASKLKVVPIEIGGGFGGKIAIHGEAVAVLLSQKCRRPVKLVLSREEVLQGGSGPAAGVLIDIAVGAGKDGRLVAIDGQLSSRCGRIAGAQPVARDAGFGRALSMPEPRSAGLRRCHQQAAHRGLSRARRHPGGLRHGAGDGHAVPATRYGPAGISPAQRVGDRQHHADRHAVSRRSGSPRSSSACASTPAGAIRCPRAACRADAGLRSAIGVARP